MLYCPNFFWNVLQVWMTGKDVYLQMTWSWPDKTWNIFCSYCLQWNTSQSKFRNHYFLFLFAFSILFQLFLIWGCNFIFNNILKCTVHAIKYGYVCKCTWTYMCHIIYIYIYIYIWHSLFFCWRLSNSVALLRAPPSGLRMICLYSL